MIHFAYPLPWWLAIMLLAAIALAVFVEYRRAFSPLTRRQRALLIALRATVLIIVSLLFFRPVVVLPPAANRDAIVPVLVDVSRSMRLADETGQTRAARAAAIVTSQLLPALSAQFRPELYSVGDGLAAERSNPGGR